MSDAPQPDRASPTVVVARRAVPGRERDLERWLARLTAAAGRFPGHRGSSVQPPGPAHPDEWVVVYRFDDVDALELWLRSEDRADLLAAGAHLVESTTEQRVALAARPEPVTCVVSVCIRPEHRDEHRRLQGEIVEALHGFEGFLSAETFEPVEGVQDETVIVFSFDTRGHLDRWLDSEQRTEMLDRMEPLIDGTRTVSVLGGFAGWFPDEGGRPARTWKSAAVVLLALFPTSLSLTFLRGWLLPDLPTVPTVFLLNLLGVLALSYVLLPPLTERLSDWLRR